MMSSTRSKLVAALLAGVSPTTVQFLIDQEGWISKVYLDAVGLPTVCVGVMDRTLTVGKTYSDDECVALTAKQLHMFITAIDGAVKVQTKHAYWLKISTSSINRSSVTCRAATNYKGFYFFHINILCVALWIRIYSYDRA